MERKRPVGESSLLPELVARFVGLMNRTTANDVPRLSAPLALGWLCALSPYGVLFVIGTAWLHQQPVWSALGPLVDQYRQ